MPTAAQVRQINWNTWTQMHSLWCAHYLRWMTCSVHKNTYVVPRVTNNVAGKGWCNMPELLGWCWMSSGDFASIVCVWVHVFLTKASFCFPLAAGKEMIEMYFDFRLFRLWKSRQHSKLLDYDDLLWHHPVFCWLVGQLLRVWAYLCTVSRHLVKVEGLLSSPERFLDRLCVRSWKLEQQWRQQQLGVFFKPFWSDRVWPCRFSRRCAFSPAPIFTFCLCLTLEKRKKGDKSELEKQVTHHPSLNVSETPTTLRFLSTERLLDTRVTVENRKISLCLRFEDVFFLPRL